MSWNNSAFASSSTEPSSTDPNSLEPSTTEPNSLEPSILADPLTSQPLTSQPLAVATMDEGDHDHDVFSSEDEEDFVPPPPPGPPPSTLVSQTSRGFAKPPIPSFHGHGKGNAVGKPPLASFGVSMSHQEEDEENQPSLGVGKGGFSKGKGKGGGSFGEVVEEEAVKEERRKTVARENAKKKVLASISHHGNNLRGTPYILVDRVTGEERQVPSARKILAEVIEILDDSDLMGHYAILTHPKGPQLAISTIVNFLAAFRMGAPNEEGIQEGATLSFDENQRPQEVTLGKPRFSVFKYDPTTDDGKGQEVQIVDHYARNMRIMGDRFYRKAQEKEDLPTEGEDFDPPYSLDLLYSWGKEEYCKDKASYSKRGTRKGTNATKTTKGVKTSKRGRGSTDQGDGSVTTTAKKLKKKLKKKSKTSNGRMATRDGAGALLNDGKDFSSWKTPYHMVSHVLTNFPEMSLETAAQVLAPFDDGFRVYNPVTSKALEARKNSKVVLASGGGEKDVLSKEDAHALTGALETLGLPSRVAAVLAQAPTLSWPQVATAIGCPGDKKDLVSALSIVRS